MLSKREFGRQALHIIIGLLIIVTYYLNYLSSLAVFLMIIIGGLASVLSKRVNLPFFTFFLNHFERDEHKKTFPGRGMIYFFVGILLVMRLFEKDIALAAMIILTLGDSVSHLVGERFGRIKNVFNGHSKKLFEGTLAGIIAGFIGAVIFVPVPEAFLGSAAAMFAEVIEIDLNKKSLDDNLIIPLVAGTVMLLVRTYI